MNTHLAVALVFGRSLLRGSCLTPLGRVPSCNHVLLERYPTGLSQVGDCKDDFFAARELGEGRTVLQEAVAVATGAGSRPRIRFFFKNLQLHLIIVLISIISFRQYPSNSRIRLRC
jgi:hypothetical protein